MPKYQCSTFKSCSLQEGHIFVVGFLEAVVIINHILRLHFVSQVSCSSSRQSRLCWRRDVSLTLFICGHKRHSSAKRRTFEDYYLTRRVWKVGNVEANVLRVNIYIHKCILTLQNVSLCPSIDNMTVVQNVTFCAQLFTDSVTREKQKRNSMKIIIMKDDL